MAQTSTDEKPLLRISIKQRNAIGKWQSVPLASMAGKTIKQVLLQLDGTESVAEFVYDGNPHYLCGTDQWVRWMAENRGQSMRINKAIEALESRLIDFLNETIPCVESIAEIFPGAEICSHANEVTP